MSAKKICSYAVLASLLSMKLFAQPETLKPADTHAWAYQTIAEQLGWKIDHCHPCGGYYLDQPFHYPPELSRARQVAITSNHGLISQVGTSFLEDEVTITRFGQEIISNKAYVYRTTAGTLSAVDVIGNVRARDDHTLIIARKGRYNFKSQAKSLIDILYRTNLIDRRIAHVERSLEQQKTPHRVTGLTAWGEAYEFSQEKPFIYELTQASFSTCPPSRPAWQVKGSHILLNKATGRGYATHARLLVKNIPVLYVPYFSFSIDKQRKTGFLWPTVGIASDKWGPYVLAPFYWNMAPNYDMTITPGLMKKRGTSFNDKFRYLTTTSGGEINFTLVPHDREFANMQEKANNKFYQTDNSFIQAELSRLENASATRGAFVWRDNSLFNENWSSHLDFNYASDDYYLQDFGNTLNEITENQLLQEGDVFYKGRNVNFTGRLQAYQTLHPLIDQGRPILNQYRRLPQLILNADYPDQWYGADFFISSELTYFTILKTPGSPYILPKGTRGHLQPGISWPLYWTYFYINPRLQLDLTGYELKDTSETNTPKRIGRSIPIFDVAANAAFDRHMNLFGHEFTQTLEPQIYYTFIPYRSQKKIPVFDTTVITLNYDQLFNYNRFTGLDRLGDANQIAAGINTRFIDGYSGFEKVRFGIGEIFYFRNRRVTLCNDPNICTDNPENPANDEWLSPISAIFEYHLNPLWKFSANGIWNPAQQQLGNATITFNYQTDIQHILNFSFSYARNGDDIFSGVQTNTSANNLKITDFSAVWPFIHNVVMMGRWSQDWGGNHLQNLLYGLQYDTCCWGVRLVGGKAFTNLDKNNQPQYNTEFYLQFDLKGLGDIGAGNPSRLLSSITGYKPQFGQEI